MQTYRTMTITIIFGVRVFSTTTLRSVNYRIRLTTLHHVSSFSGPFCKIKATLRGMLVLH